jgi:hypothetical protein
MKIEPMDSSYIVMNPFVSSSPDDSAVPTTSTSLSCADVIDSPLWCML